MTTCEIESLQAQVDRLDPATARRVAKLVFECRASLRDALLAVEMSDGRLAPARPARPSHWPWHRANRRAKQEKGRARAVGC